MVAVVGRPNVGKSSLINAMVGDKVAIVSDHPQTTRHTIRGVLTEPGHQIVFVDTPGYHRPRTPLGERLNQRVDDAVSDVDVVLMVVDAAAGVGRGDAFVSAREVVPFGGPKLCAVNKVDLLRRRGEVPQLDAAARLAEFDHVIPTSARTRLNLAELRDLIARSLPEGEALFPGAESTDQPLELRISEIVREKALAVTREEVPHSVAVVVEEIERDAETGFVTVSARLMVERDSQKGILIGKGGETLKLIGTRARADLERLLSARVHLDLRVKVLKEWQRSQAALDRLGF
jgi:GTP-binding protein Era